MVPTRRWTIEMLGRPFKFEFSTFGWLIKYRLWLSPKCIDWQLRYQDIKCSWLGWGEMLMCLLVSLWPAHRLFSWRPAELRMASCGCLQERNMVKRSLLCLIAAQLQGPKLGRGESNVWSWAVIILLPMRPCFLHRGIFTYNKELVCKGCQRWGNLLLVAFCNLLVIRCSTFSFLTFL